MKFKKTLSIIIPVYNEKDSIKELYTELIGVLNKNSYRYEIIFIDDGSHDGTNKILSEIRNKDQAHVQLVTFKRNVGKSFGLQAGFNMCRGDIVITMDSDLQDDPHEIPRLIQKIENRFDVVSGWKQERKDGFIKRFTSKIYNSFTNLLSSAKLHDHNCGLKAYKIETVKTLTLAGGMYRFITALLATKGYKVTEIPVHHRPRTYGVSKYGLMRFINGCVDYIIIFYLIKLSKSFPIFENLHLMKSIDSPQTKIDIQQKIAELIE